MKHIKLYAAFFAVASLILLSAAQLHSVKADDNNGYGTAISQGSGNNGTESENGDNALSGSDNGNSGENNAMGEDENSQNGPSLTINAADKVAVNGASLISSSGQSLVIKIFGLSLNLAVTSSTSLIGVIGSSTSTIANMQTGDVIDLTGQIDPNSGLIAADQIRDETMQQQSIQSIQQEIQSLLKQLQQLQDQLKSQQSGG